MYLSDTGSYDKKHSPECGRHAANVAVCLKIFRGPDVLFVVGFKFPTALPCPFFKDFRSPAGGSPGVAKRRLKTIRQFLVCHGTSSAL